MRCLTSVVCMGQSYLRCKLAGRELVLLVMIWVMRLCTQLAQGLQYGLCQALLGQLLWLELR